jgi:hypothetical protein
MKLETSQLSIVGAVPRSCDAKTEKEVCSLIEAGFEYVTEFESARIFGRRKL